MPDAPGLPDRKRFTPIRESSGGTWPMVVHRHRADRAGLHHDLRIGDRRAGVAHSWAYRSGRMPRVGERIEVHQQPDHTIPYMKFKGTIAEGYGKGSVGIARSGKVEVLDSGPEKLHFRLGRRRFVLVKTPRYGERSWLLIGLPAKKREKVAVHLVPTPDLAEEMLKAAAEATDSQATRDRTIGHGLGSAASNLVTGYALAPVLYPGKKKSLSMLQRVGLKKKPNFFQRNYGTRALVPALALTGGAFVGGAMKENIQAGYERWSEKRREKKADDVRAYPGCAKCMTEPMEHCSICRQHVSTDWKTGWCAECAEVHERRRARSHLKAAEVVEGLIKASEDDVETLRLQLAGAGVAALGYAQDVDRSNPYWTASMGDAQRLYSEKERLRKVVEERVGHLESVDPAVRGILKAASAGNRREIAGNSGETREKPENEPVFELRKSAETRKKATGLLLYTNNPSERPSAPPPKPTKGFAQHFGGRFNPTVSRHRHAERTADEWMRGSAEYVDIGTRPNLVQAAREVLQIEPGKPFPRAQAMKMVRERQEHGQTAVTRRRAGVLKGMEDAQDSPEEVRELLTALETSLKHPRVRYFELTEKN